MALASANTSTRRASWRLTAMEKVKLSNSDISPSVTPRICPTPARPTSAEAGRSSHCCNRNPASAEAEHDEGPDAEEPDRGAVEEEVEHAPSRNRGSPSPPPDTISVTAHEIEITLVAGLDGDAGRAILQSRGRA